jgi:hypothetical protein
MTLSSFIPKLTISQYDKKPLAPHTKTNTSPVDAIETIDPNTIPLDSLSDNSTAPLLTKPQLLKPLPLANPDPLQPLDHLVTKQSIHMLPYVPFIQEISIGIEGVSLLKNTWNILRSIKKHETNRPYEYAGNLGILFRKNIQLAVDLGYVKLYPEQLKINKSAYSTNGFYTSIGLDYLNRYSITDNIYIGLHYSKAYFTNHTLPDKSNEPVLSKELTASWFEIVLGSETRLLDKLNIYGGCTLRIGWLYNFEVFEPAEKYIIPGYGNNANKFSPSLNLYILYRISFIERMIRLT